MRTFDYAPMYYHPSYSFWPDGTISLIITVLFWVAIISLFVYIMKRAHGHGTAGCCGGACQSHGACESESEADYMSIIKERYAKGEIDKKQFEELKKDLSE
jgi:uncharacterized membrane protein